MIDALQFMSIRERIEFNVCILIYKMVNELCLNYLANQVEVVLSEKHSTNETKR